MLLLAAACATPPREGSPALAADAALSSRVRAALLADPLVGGSAIGVSVRNGVVTLDGSVREESAARRAVDTARSTPGTSAVTDRLVYPGRPARFLP